MSAVPPPSDASGATATGDATPPPGGRFNNAAFREAQAKRNDANTQQYVKMGTEIVTQVVNLAAKFAAA